MAGFDSFGAGRFLPGGIPALEWPPQEPGPLTSQAMPEAPQAPVERSFQLPGYWTGSPKTLVRDGFTYVRPDRDPGGTNFIPYTWDQSVAPTNTAPSQMTAYQPDYSLFYNPQSMLQMGQPLFGAPWYYGSK